MNELIYEAKLCKNCIKTGLYEKAYESAQNIEDELTRLEIQKSQSFWGKLKSALKISM